MYGGNQRSSSTLLFLEPEIIEKNPKLISTRWANSRIIGTFTETVARSEKRKRKNTPGNHFLRGKITWVQEWLQNTILATLTVKRGIKTRSASSCAGFGLGKGGFRRPMLRFS